MTVSQALLLGLVQGLTEFLPVSSSGHLAVGKLLFGLEEVPVLFDVILHVATLMVVFYVFRRRIAAIVGALARLLRRRTTEEDHHELRLVGWIVLATAITVVVALPIAELDASSRPRLIGALFIGTAGALLSTRFAPQGGAMGRIGALQAVIIGLAQALGVFPGVSRSGITIAAARHVGLARQDAGEFAFLISIPAILGALVLTLGESAELGRMVAPVPLTAGFLAALISGLLALRLLLRLLRAGRLGYFAVYLIPLGVITIFALG